MNFKELGKKVVALTATNRVAWSLYRLCGRMSGVLARVHGHARFARETGERDETLRRVTQELFPHEPVVESGPFRGLRYPSARSYGSALLPKLFTESRRWQFSISSFH